MGDLDVRCETCDETFSTYNGITDFESLLAATQALAKHNSEVHYLLQTVRVV